jgi:hypothetical protein
MAHAFDLMQRVRNVVCESGLFKNPLAIRLGKSGKPEKKQQGYQYVYLFIHMPSFRT